MKDPRRNRLRGAHLDLPDRSDWGAAAAERAGLTAALSYVRQGDTLTVWKLDRLGRSVKEVLTIADDLHARDVGVRILAGQLSGAYTPAGEGKFFFTMMAAFAELERDMILERTMAELVAARAQGRNSGRPTVMDAESLPRLRPAVSAARAPRRSPGPSASAARRFTATWPLTSRATSSLHAVKPGSPATGRVSCAPIRSSR